MQVFAVLTCVFLSPRRYNRLSLGRPAQNLEIGPDQRRVVLLRSVLTLTCFSSAFADL
jgi:hypothetical protein